MTRSVGLIEASAWRTVWNDSAMEVTVAIHRVKAEEGILWQLDTGSPVSFRSYAKAVP